MKMVRLYVGLGLLFFLSQGTANAFSCRELFEDHFGLPIKVSHRIVGGYSVSENADQIAARQEQQAFNTVVLTLNSRGYVQTVLPGSQVKVLVFNRADHSHVTLIDEISSRSTLSQNSVHIGEILSTGKEGTITYVEVKLADGTTRKVQALAPYQYLFVKVIN